MGVPAEEDEYKSYSWINPIEGVIDGVFPPCDYRYIFEDVHRRVFALIPMIPRKDLQQHLDHTDTLFAIPRDDLKSQSSVKALSEIRDTIALDDDSSLEWHSYFALNALLSISEFIFFDNLPPNCLTVSDDVWAGGEFISLEEAQDNARRQASVACLTSAIESISRAEEMVRLNDRPDPKIERLAQEQISQRNRNAADQRHKPVNDLKKEFIVYRLEHSEISSTIQAARRFLSQLPAEKQKLLSPTNGPDTLRRAFAEWEKSHMG